MMLNDDLTIPPEVVDALDLYRNKVEIMFDAYSTQYTKSNVDCFNSTLPGVSEQFIQTNNDEDIERAQVQHMHILIKPSKQVQDVYFKWARSIAPSDVETIWTSGHFFYPSDGGFMGWHTNSDQPGIILYVTHTKESGQSFFRYYNKENGQINTSYDKGGWHGRMFKTSSKPEQYFWHCVYSKTDRLSVGIEQQ